MLSDENNRGWTSFADEVPSNRTEPGQTPNESSRTQVDRRLERKSVIHATGPGPTPSSILAEMHFEPLFIIQTWHRFYAKALMETDPASCRR